MKIKVLTNPFIIKLVKDLIDRIPVTERGVANKAFDATSWSGGFKKFCIGKRKYVVEIKSCWGNEIQISTVSHTHKEPFIDLYIDNIELRTWKRHKGMFHLIYKFNKTNEPIRLGEEHEMDEDPMGCLSDYI